MRFNTKASSAVAVLLGMVMVVLSVGCGLQGSPRAREQGGQDDTGDSGIQVRTNFEMEETEEGTTITTDDGAWAKSGSNLELPDSFPRDVPQYPGMEITSVADRLNGDWGLTATTPDSTDKVVAFYRSQAAANGWTETMAMDMGRGTEGGGHGNPGVLMQYWKGNRKLGGMVREVEGKRQIVLGVEVEDQ